MPNPEDYKSVGILIKRDAEGNTFEKVDEKDMKKTVNVLRNTSNKPRYVQNVGTNTDVIMGKDGVLPITLEDEIAGVPNEIKGTGIKKEKYDPAKHDRPNPMTGGMPGMEPVNAQDSLPDDHPAKKAMKRIEQKLGKPLTGTGTYEECKQIIDDAKAIAEEED